MSAFEVGDSSRLGMQHSSDAKGLLVLEIVASSPILLVAWQ